MTCRSRHEAIELEQQLESEGYRPIRHWKHLIVGADTREDADALAARSTARSSREVRSCGRKRSTPTSFARLPSSAESSRRRRSRRWPTISILSSSTSLTALRRSSRRTDARRPRGRGGCGARSSRAATATSRRGGCRGRAAASTRSAQPGTRATPSWRSRCAPTDPALLHYRSGAFYLARPRQVGRDGVPDIMLGVTAASDEPIAGGRHKVFGHHDLAIIPQTSTIASHLPAGRRRRDRDRPGPRSSGVDCAWPRDADRRLQLRRCLAEPRDRAGRVQHRRARCATSACPLPLLFVCEDNGLGISVPSPAGWVEARAREPADLRTRPPPVTIRRGRSTRRGARAMGARDTPAGRAPPPHRPLPRSRRRRCRGRLPHAAGVRADFDPRPAARHRPRGSSRAGGAPETSSRRSTSRRARACARSRSRPHGVPQLETAADVMRPLAPRSPAAVAEPRRDEAGRRAGAEPLTLAHAINGALADAARARIPSRSLFGEDVAAKGGVYGVTRGLHARFGAGRVFDTLLDETSILGLALGARDQRLPAAAGDPVPRLPPQRRGSAPRRGGDAAVLLAGPVPQRHGRADRRATATRRASAGTSTTTTRSPSCATSPAS